MTLASLPQPIASSAATQHPEYPSVIPISTHRWAIATGTGSLYIFELDQEELSGKFIARYDLPGTGSDLSPFIIQAIQLEREVAKILLSRSVLPPEPRRKTSSSSTFELLEVELNPTQSNGIDDDPQPLEVKWRLQGGDLPVWCGWQGEGWMVLSSEVYQREQAQEEETDAERTKREEKERMEKLGLGASLPGGNATSGVGASMEVDAVDTQDEEEEAEKEWPFSWTQTADSLSVTIPLPPGTTRKHVQVSLTAEDFSLSISTSPSPVLAAFLAKPTRSFWTSIDPSTSTYSFNSIKNLLELELSKVDINTRWPSVFTPIDEDDEEDEEEEVPETLTAEMLAAVKASFSNIKTRNEDEPAGNHPAIPALIREEMDYDLEDGEDFGENTTGVFGEPGGGTKVGRDVFVVYIKDGSPSFSKAQSSIVSLPMDGTGRMMVKSAVDGVLFEAPEGSPAKVPWKHVATSPALSFVLSSKRDLRLVRHVSTEGEVSHEPKKQKRESATTVLAFDAGGLGTAAGNVYVYYPPQSTTTAKQGVVRVSGSDRGALLGVGEVLVKEKKVVVALCEKSLVVLHGVL